MTRAYIGARYQPRSVARANILPHAINLYP